MGSNDEAAAILREIADLLDVLGERFKPEAYRRAARSIEGLGEDLRGYATRGALDEIPGVGTAIAEKLREFLRDGTIGYRDRLTREVPAGLVELLRIPGLGPKTVRRFWTELGIQGPAELAGALDAGRLDGVKGFGPTRIRALREALRAQRPTGRIGLWEATRIARALAEGLRGRAPLDRLEIAGSFRRGKETVGDLDLLVISAEPERVFDALGALPEVGSVQLRGGTKETVILRSGTQVDLRIVPPESYGAALQYFTGSKDHNVRLRTRARDLGLKVNEYGVYRGEERIAGATEASVYGALGLPEIPPELREDRGELEAAEAGRLPKLLRDDELLGDLHLHLPSSPSKATEILTAARARGHRYLGAVVPASTSREEVRAWRTALRTPGDHPEVFLALEGDPSNLADAPAGAEVDYRLRSGAVGPPRPDEPEGPGWLAAVHLPISGKGGADVDPARLGPWIAWATAQGAALEVTATPGVDGLDSAGARSALSQGARLLLSAGGDGTEADERLAVAAKIARRAGAEAGQVLNAGERPLEGIRSPRSTPTPRRTRKAP